jgi:hypothetical protein
MAEFAFHEHHLEAGREEKAITHFLFEFGQKGERSRLAKLSEDCRGDELFSSKSMRRL